MPVGIPKQAGPLIARQVSSSARAQRLPSDFSSSAVGKPRTVPTLSASNLLSQVQMRKQAMAPPESKYEEYSDVSFLLSL